METKNRFSRCWEEVRQVWTDETARYFEAKHKSEIDDALASVEAAYRYFEQTAKKV